MTDSCLDTKEKILQVARVLFAEQGFEGTSVRQIAVKAQVNLASVNYHFSNKESLFTEILIQGHLQCSDHIRKYYEDNSPNVEDLLLYVFGYFMENSHDLISSFKMLMSTQHRHNMPLQENDGEIGPPGGAVIAKALKNEVGKTLSAQDEHWAVKTLFGHVIHSCIIYNSCLKSRQTPLPFSSIEDLKVNIRRLVKIVVRELKMC